MALPKPDYPRDFPTDSAFFLGTFVLKRFPKEDRPTAVDQATILLDYAMGRLYNYVTEVTPRTKFVGGKKVTAARLKSAFTPMTAAECKAVAKTVADDHARNAAFGLDWLTIIKWVITILAKLV